MQLLRASKGTHIVTIQFECSDRAIEDFRKDAEDSIMGALNNRDPDITMCFIESPERGPVVYDLITGQELTPPDIFTPQPVAAGMAARAVAGERGATFDRIIK